MRAGGSSYWTLAGLVWLLCLVGLIMVLSASSVASLNVYGTPWHFFARQLLGAMLGLGGFVTCSRLPLKKLRKLSVPLVAASCVLLVMVLVPGIGVRAGGAARWIGTASLQIQPSELAKLALVLFGADVLDRRSGRGTWGYRISPVLAVTAGFALLVICQPDMGTTMVLVLIAAAMLVSYGLPGAPLGALAGGGTLMVALMAVVAPYRMRRLTSFLHPMRHASTSGYQATQGLFALSGGHLLGEGLGASIASYGYLPNAQTDFIFAVVGEETGLVGAALLTGFFFVLAVIGVRICARARDDFESLLAVGITAWLVGQALINMGAVVGVLPVTGVPLPFVSFGSSSLVIELIGAGLLANVARRA